jgi:hypothetical protein
LFKVLFAKSHRPCPVAFLFWGPLGVHGDNCDPACA